MRTLAVMSQKGGTGKTTVAVHMAVAAVAAGRRALIVDTDPQRSAVEWRRLRGGVSPAVIEAKTGALFVAQQAALRAEVDLMVVDTRPSADDGALEAMRVADLSAVVLRPSYFDLRAIERTVETCQAIGRPLIAVINQAPPSRGGCETQEVRDAVAALKDMGVGLAPVGLRARTAYPRAMGRGLTAQEAFPETPAVREIGALWAAMEARLWPQAAPLTFRRPDPDSGPAEAAE